MSSTSKTSEPLPSYKQPPVDEVVCGFRFEPLRHLKVPHIGLLWEKFRNEYPTAQHAVPIATDTSFIVDEATGIPLPRVWFISKADNELIQFQLDRFYYNWRHRGDDYPRYPSIIKKFEKAKSYLDNPANVAWQVRFELPQGKGWLNAKLNQATRKVDGVPSLILELTAKGFGEEKTAKAMRNWFDLAHEWIVRGFTELTAKEIQETFWKRER